MKRILVYYIAVFLAIVGAAQIVNGFDYMYFSETETTPLGESSGFFSVDSLWGPIRTNDSL